MNDNGAKMVSRRAVTELIIYLEYLAKTCIRKAKLIAKGKEITKITIEEAIK